MSKYYAVVKLDENIIVGISDVSEYGARIDALNDGDYVIQCDIYGNIVTDNFKYYNISRGLYEQVKLQGGDVSFREYFVNYLVPDGFHHVLVNTNDNIVHGIGVTKMDAYVDSVKNSLTKTHDNPNNVSIIRVTKEFFNMVKKFGGDIQYNEKYKYSE